MQYKSLLNKADEEKTRLFSTANGAALSNHNGNMMNDNTRGVDSVLRKAAEGIGVASRRIKNTGTGELSEPLASFDLASLGTNGDMEKGEGVDDEDPYFVFRDDLLRRMAVAEEAFSDYLNTVQMTDTAVNTYEIKDRKKQWKKQVKHVESTLQDLQATVRLVEKNREQFLHSISHDELQNRKVFVNEIQKRLIQMKQDGNSTCVREKILQDEKDCAIRRSAATNKQKDPGIISTLKNSLSSSANDEEAMVMDKRAQTQILLEQQDETLDQLDAAVDRVGVVAGAIHEEIKSQNKMLTELEEDLTDVEEKLGVVMGKLGKLLKTKSKCQIGLILALSLAVVILFFLVLYT